MVRRDRQTRYLRAIRAQCKTERSGSFYYGLDTKGVARDLVATSSDLLHPVKVAQPLIDIGPPGSVDSVYAHKPSVVTAKHSLYHF
jgi:hypothetical protein